MNKLFLSIMCLVFLVGCTTTSYVCPDGVTVSTVEECQNHQASTYQQQNTQPIKETKVFTETDDDAKIRLRKEIGNIVTQIETINIGLDAIDLKYDIYTSDGCINYVKDWILLTTERESELQNLRLKYVQLSNILDGNNNNCKVGMAKLNTLLSNYLVIRTTPYQILLNSDACHEPYSSRLDNLNEYEDANEKDTSYITSFTAEWETDFESCPNTYSYINGE